VIAVSKKSWWRQFSVFYRFPGIFVERKHATINLFLRQMVLHPGTGQHHAPIFTGAADKAADLGGCKSLYRQLPDSGG
jgi:hypothetical protein